MNSLPTHPGRRATLAFLLLLSLPSLAGAGLDAGSETYKRGDYATALKEWRPAAEQGEATAQYGLGLLYYHGQGVPLDEKEAHRWFLLAAAQGHARAQTYLGMTYHYGDGVPQDYSQALKWYRLAVEQGDPLAYFRLGLLYKNGEGVLKDYIQAYKWLSLALGHGEQGEDEAVEVRDMVARRMTPAQMAEAQRLAREWRPKKGKK